jgi:hypothetical protein
VPDATQGDQIERVANCAYPVFKHLEKVAAQGDVIDQDDPPVRILTLIAENPRAQAQACGGARATPRTGM